MTLPDVNVLVHAFRSDSSDHSLCRHWLDKVVNGESRYGISPQVLSGVIRVTTHPKVFAKPSGVVEALDFCEILLAQPHCVLVKPGPQHWSIFSRMCIDADARGNLVPDAWYAALAVESGCEWVTLDRDYARFPGLNWRLPS
jgi:toxin-antitoxin system PIN domain toxin